MNSWSERSPSPGAWTSVLAIAGRQTRQNFRHVQTAIFMFVLPVAFGLLFGRLLHVAVASPPDRWVRVVMPGVSADMEGVARFLFYFGFLAMFVLTTALMNGAGILEERENRTLARLLVQGVPYGQVIAGHALGAALTSAIQTVVLLAIAYPMGGWPRSSVPATVAVALALALAAAGSAVGAAGVAGAGPRLRAAGGVVGALLAMLGGAWWPLEVEPTTMQKLGRLSPVFWAMDGVHRAVALGAGVADLIMPILALLLFAALGGMVGVWGMRRWYA